jgi:hypothetical protein
MGTPADSPLLARRCPTGICCTHRAREARRPSWLVVALGEFPRRIAHARERVGSLRSTRTRGSGGLQLRRLGGMGSKCLHPAGRISPTPPSRTLPPIWGQFGKPDAPPQKGGSAGQRLCPCSVPLVSRTTGELGERASGEPSDTGRGTEQGQSRDREKWVSVPAVSLGFLVLNRCPGQRDRGIVLYPCEN